MRGSVEGHLEALAVGDLRHEEHVGDRGRVAEAEGAGRARGELRLDRVKALA
jgi:hypothetical protein